MAIQDENQNTNNQPKITPPKPDTGGTWSFQDQGLFPSPIPKGIGSEYYTKVKTKLIEKYKEARPEVEITLIDLSRASDPSLDFSCILVASRLRDYPKLGVAVHLLLLAKTGDPIPPYTEQVFGRTVNVRRVPSDAINNILVNKAIQAVKQHFNINEVHFVDGTVVGERFNPDNEIHVHRLALTAAMAGATELNARRPDFHDISLNKLNKTGQCQADINFIREQREDAVGNVFRSDVLISFSNRPVGGVERSHQLNTGDRNVKFSELSGFMDAVWYPMSDPSGLANVFVPNQMAQTQKFVARFVISNIDANFAPTPGSVLLALSTSLSIRNPNVWIQAFRPLNTGRNEIDITDIGALNIEGNIPIPQPNGLTTTDPSGYGRPIDTKSADFNLEQLGIFISTLFHKDIMIAMDIPEYGSQTYYLQMFAAAAAGVQNAETRIISAANELTAGQFSRFFPAGERIFATRSERIHNGYWVDNNGIVRDIRDFDHIAVANLVGTRDPKMIRDWSDTFLRLEYPEIQRLEARWKMIEQLSGETAKHTGYSQRVTFTKPFLEALDQSISANQLRVTINTPLTGSDFYNQRGVAAYAPSALLGYSNSFMQGSSFSTPANPSGYYQQYRF